MVRINDAASTYFALTYDYGAGLRQYIAGGSTIHLIGPPVGSPSLRLCDLNAGTLLVAGDQQLSAEALQFLTTHPGVHTQAFHALDEFLETHHADLAAKWTLVSRNEYLGQSALALAVFKGRTVDVSPSSTNCNARWPDDVQMISSGAWACASRNKSTHSRSIASPFGRILWQRLLPSCSFNSSRFSVLLR